MSTPLLAPQNGAVLALANPLAGPDQKIAEWFHARLTENFSSLLQVLSGPGSSLWIGIVLFLATLFLLWKRNWFSLIMVVVCVPGGMLLNELIKVLVQRPRPYMEGSFVDWSGYSFASGHTIGATLLYGQLALFLVPLLKIRHRRAILFTSVAVLVLSVGFSRIALGAHYLTDVISAVFFGVLWLALCLFAERKIHRGSLPLPIGPAAQ